MGRAYATAIEEDIIREIAQIQIEAGRLSTPRAGGSTLGRRIDPTSLAKVELAQRRIQQLQRVQSWMKQDPELMGVLDTFIGKQVKVVRRRQALVTLILSIVSLIVGWLLSALGPATVLVHYVVK
jgi:hypothetical protein